MNPQEAAATSVAFQAALARLGAEVVAVALELWRRFASRPEQYMDEVLGLIEDARTYAFDLAVAYYRLHRALHTGETVHRPGESGQGEVSLDELRQDFLDELPADLPEDVTYTPGSQDATITIDPEPVFAEEDRDARNVRAVKEAEWNMALVAFQNLEKKLQAIEEEIDRRERGEQPVTAREAERMREEAEQDAGTRAAAEAERVAKDSARGAIFDAASHDRRVIGYVRVSLTGTPCGWCAMLISRGVTLRGSMYRTQESAGPTRQQLESGAYDDGDKYHTNCNCYSEPVYSDSQIDSDPIYFLNRYYGEMWPKVTKGKSGKEALSAWRAWIREQRKVPNA